MFNSGKSVSEDYKGFSAQVMTRDTFDEDFFMMPRFRGSLKVASEFTSAGRETVFRSAHF